MASELPAPSESESAAGKYRVLKRLAVGGMAEIYLARVTGIEGFEKHVVLKKIRPVHSEDPRFVAMFLDEARLAATLHHQNIAQVYDIGELDGSFFFSMEFLHGQDCQAILKNQVKQQERLPLEHAMTIVTGAAAGLHYAHDKTSSTGKALNVVHRDVSPSNVFVTYDGAVKIVDFGIARAAQREGPETRSGTLKGKISYMSPEQCRGEELDRRSDIFALGIVLYETTTTSRLFRKGNDADFLVMQRIVAGEITPPTERTPGYPKELERVVMRALEVEPDDRYQNARDMLLDLENVAASLGLPLSTARLSTFLEGAFGRKLEPWHTLEQDNDEPDEVPPLERTVSTTASPACPPRVLEELSCLEISAAGDETSARLAEDLAEDVPFTQSDVAVRAAAAAAAAQPGVTATAMPSTPVRTKALRATAAKPTVEHEARAQDVPAAETRPEPVHTKPRAAIAGALVLVAAVAAFLLLRPLLAGSEADTAAPAENRAANPATPTDVRADVHETPGAPSAQAQPSATVSPITAGASEPDGGAGDDPAEPKAAAADAPAVGAKSATPSSKRTKKRAKKRAKKRSAGTKDAAKDATADTIDKDSLIDTTW